MYLVCTHFRFCFCHFFYQYSACDIVDYRFFPRLDEELLSCCADIAGLTDVLTASDEWLRHLASSLQQAAAALRVPEVPLDPQAAIQALADSLPTLPREPSPSGLILSVEGALAKA